MGIAERIPDLSDKELENLHTNAVRLAQSGTQAQRQQAEALLPLIGAAMEERRQTRATTAAKTRKTATKRAAVAKLAKDQFDQSE